MVGKNHEIRELVNDLTKLYRDRLTPDQRLRSAISKIVNKHIEVKNELD